jgi:hypothetical protein
VPQVGGRRNRDSAVDLEPAVGRLVGADMEETLLRVIDDDIDVPHAGHRLIIQYGTRAAEIARSRARTAADVNDEQPWLDIAEAVARDKPPLPGAR